MNEIELIGRVATEFLRQNLLTDTSDSSEGVARFLLDKLTGEQVARICHKVLNDAYLKSKVAIKVPRKLVDEYGLPDEVLTNKKTTFWRHASCDKDAIILANTNDDQGQSLRDITSIGARDLKSVPELWVNVVSKDLPLTDDQMRYWKQALRGLQEASDCSLEQFSKYVVMVYDIISTEGISVIRALGWALPALRLPRDSSFFESIPENKLGHMSKWRKMYIDAYTKRGCYLYKQTPNRQLIENDQLLTIYEKVKEHIPTEYHTVVENFILSKETWAESTDKISELEWERDKVSLLFTEIKVLKVDLGTKTKQYFEDEFPDSLTDEENDYLSILRKRKVKDASDEDKDFYERHRHELDGDRLLKSQWDRFVYGKPIECTDFLVGLVESIHRLFDQCDEPTGSKELRIRTSKGSGKKTWLDINEDVGLYFCTSYRGIEKITSNQVFWDTHWLFKYDELIADRRQRQGYKKNTSVSKTATQIAFDVELTYSDLQGLKQKNNVRLIWQFPNSSIGLELHDDLTRLSRNPFSYITVAKNPISKKGKLQSISLNDVGTLQAVFGQDRGSLVGTYSRSVDLNKVVRKEMKNANVEGRLSTENYSTLKESWSRFKDHYARAINDWLKEGLSSDSLLDQCKVYEKLLTDLRHYATGDINRINIWHPIMNLGNIQVDDKKPISIITPWHPMRMAAKAVKVRQVSSLINYVLQGTNVDFGDSKLFFTDIALELKHPFYPEVSLGYEGKQATLLCISDSVNDYSLMESPVREFEEHETNEDPKEATEKVITMVKKYIELQPHERTNLSVALFNCDSIRLPQAIVNGISSIHDSEEEVRCQVILRHRELTKLSDLYMKMIESADHDPDMMVPSELSKDFMARLRIGVMADAAPVYEVKDGKPVDIVFLQNVISKEAKLVWVPVSVNIFPDLIDHIPPRWGKRRPASKDELKSTVYLTSPRQTNVGWTYLKTVHQIVTTEAVEENICLLPARQISFQNEKTREIFDEAHTLGEWVINYDELLEPRLLKNQGVQVIKYQHSRTQGPNMVVSSRSKLNLLKVLVKRRLDSLNLSLYDEELYRLTEEFIDDANDISGDIVLRAAKRGVFASELLGVVLSKALISTEVSSDNLIGWFFLDDYASWLGQKEEQIADIMALAPVVNNGVPYLKVIITEAKYVDSKGLAEARKNSQKQLRDTITRMHNAIFGNPGRLDRDLWLSRLSDLFNDGLEVPTDSIINIETWRDGIRNGTIPIEIKGYSHVFVSSVDSHVESERIKLSNVEGCYQEIYSKERVSDLVISYFKKDSLLGIRKDIGDDTPWTTVDFKFPAVRIALSRDIEDNNQDAYQDISTDEPSNEPIENSYSTLSPIDELSNHSTNCLNSEHETINGQFNENQMASWASIPLKNWIDQNATSQEANTTTATWVEQKVNTLKMALISYNLQAKVLDHRLTPNAVIVKLKGSDQLKVEDIEKKRSQLLTTHALEVISIIAQPGEVVVSIARPQRQTITLGDVWKVREISKSTSGMNMSFVIGIKEIDGELLYLNLGGTFRGLEQHAPHTLIAGATGSGKSVLLQNLILDICATNSKELAKVYLIDPKFGVDYQHLEELPHLSEGIIIDQDKAISTLEFLVEEMDRRYLLFRDQKVNSLKDYNAKIEENNRLPLFFLVHDEFAEWMLIDTYKQAISSLVQRLGVKARAAGIHLIFAAQRPDTNVLPVQLRDNLGNRLILRVESEGTSQISLGEKGAERLLGKGHLAARLQGEAGLIFAQVPFLSTDDLIKVTQIIANQ
ncbi:FtsK/SpoIIIE domain-containing protein [Brevibacillus laterosporus]|uniref:Cell division protein FtsK n=1 Tax=Brevibacillus laterosporus TaxID=1465 RepID=A0A0F7EEN9_BRELA|nr:cell division protein FtsK [Brevibacillus laterosporus]